MKLSKLLLSLFALFSFSTAWSQSPPRNKFDGPMRIGLFEQSLLGGIQTDSIEASFEELFRATDSPSNADFKKTFEELAQKDCLGKWRQRRCLRTRYQEVIDYLRAQQYLDDQSWLILSYPNARLPRLEDYFRRSRKFQNIRANKNGGEREKDISKLYTRELSVSANGFSGVTPRQYLYFNYSDAQILKLASIAKKMVGVMNSSRASINIAMNGEEDLEIELSYSEKYRLGVKLAWMEMEKCPVQYGFSSRPRMVDVLFAGIETGVFGPAALEELLKRPKLIDGYRNKRKYYFEALVSLGKAALYNTPVIGQFAAIPILIWETIESSREARDAQSASTHLF